MRVTSQIPAFTKKTALTIGNFDGVHLGHIQLINKLVQNALEQDLISVVVTFKPHPFEFFNPEKRLPRITGLDEMADILKSHGIKYLIQLNFDSAMASLTPESFWKTILLDRFQPAYIVVGQEHLFGKARTGTPEKLAEMAANSEVQVDIEPQLLVDGDRVSSTRIRKLICDGHISEARKLLGHGLLYSGVVQRGEGRGKKLGFPTANLYLPDRILPSPGVYLSETTLDNKRYRSVSYIGKSPTFNGEKLWLETHIIGVKSNLYRKRIVVDIREWIRSEKRYSSQADLVRQMEQDLLWVKSVVFSDCEQERMLP